MANQFEKAAEKAGQMPKPVSMEEVELAAQQDAPANPEPTQGGQAPKTSSPEPHNAASAKAKPNNRGRNKKKSTESKESILNEGKKAYTVTLPLSVIEKIKKIGADHNITAGAIIVGFLTDSLARYEKKNGPVAYEICQAPIADTDPTKILEFL